MSIPDELLERYAEAERLWKHNPAVMTGLDVSKREVAIKIQALDAWIKCGREKAANSNTDPTAQKRRVQNT